LANKTGAPITVTVGIVYGSTFDVLFNEPLAAAGKYIYTGGEILLPPLNQIYVSVSGSTDFYFTIKPYL
jgi:hypothetical protein